MTELFDFDMFMSDDSETKILIGKFLIALLSSVQYYMPYGESHLDSGILSQFL